MAGTYADNWKGSHATTQWVWWTERDAIGVAKYNSGSERFTSAGSDQAGKKITLFYYKKASQFTEPSSNSFSWAAVSDFPSQFHDYIVSKAVALGYERKPEQLQLAMYFHEKFEKGVKEGRAYAYRARTGTVKYIKSVDF
tara:strand:+ start:97 stop:516 length:420 start_codon:yes stop_codon:yes gene_type:complete